MPNATADAIARLALLPCSPNTDSDATDSGAPEDVWRDHQDAKVHQAGLKKRNNETNNALHNLKDDDENISSLFFDVPEDDEFYDDPADSYNVALNTYGPDMGLPYCDEPADGSAAPSSPVEGVDQFRATFNFHLARGESQELNFRPSTTAGARANVVSWSASSAEPRSSATGAPQPVAGHQRKVAGKDDHQALPRGNVAPAAPPQTESGLPEWAYNSLPRDCLMMLLTSALKHMPHEALVVARCMRAIAPLTVEEYRVCFGSMPHDQPHSEPVGGARVPEVSWAASAAPKLSTTAASQPAICAEPRPAIGCGASLVLGPGHQVQHSEKPKSPSPTRKRAWSPPSTPNSSKIGGSRGTSMLFTDSRAGTRTSVLTEHQSIEIFKLRPTERSARASMCSSLAGCYNVTPTAIRHIWDRRTWVWTTLPYWTAEDMAASLAEGTCESCKCKAIASNKIEDTCELCPINRKRGRPRGARAGKM